MAASRRSASAGSAAAPPARSAPSEVSAERRVIWGQGRGSHEHLALLSAGPGGRPSPSRSRPQQKQQPASQEGEWGGGGEVTCGGASPTDGANLCPWPRGRISASCPHPASVWGQGGRRKWGGAARPLARHLGPAAAVPAHWLPARDSAFQAGGRAGCCRGKTRWAAQSRPRKEPCASAPPRLPSPPPRGLGCLGLALAVMDCEGAAEPKPSHGLVAKSRDAGSRRGEATAAARLALCS